MKTRPHEDANELQAAGITRIARPAGSYTVTVTREPSPPDTTSPHNEQWVARDTTGTWRNYCCLEFAKTAAEAVTKMFHADEVDIVEDHGDTASAQILN